MSSDRFVFLALPNTGTFHAGVLAGLLQTGRGYRIMIKDRAGSLLPLVFNELWADALNQRPYTPVTHFAMLHSDIAPQPRWLELMLDELRDRDLDVLSVLVPIKDGRGLTSTAVMHPDTQKVRRLSMHEAFNLPETFTQPDLQEYFPGGTLLINTGCWVCRFTDEWVERIHWRLQNDIECVGGVYRAVGYPEDWLFSLDCQALGLKVGVTRKVSLLHHGSTGYSNSSPWGSWDTDQEAQGVYDDDCGNNNERGAGNERDNECGNERSESGNARAGQESLVG